MSGGGVLRNFAFLFGGRATGDAAVFVLILVIARRFGPEGSGQYGVAMAVAGFFVAFADFGLLPYTIRHLSVEGAARDLLGRIVSLRVALTALALAGLLGLAHVGPFGGGTDAIVLVIGVQQLLRRLAEGMSAAFIARGESQWAGGLEAAAKTGAATAAVTALLAGAGLATALATTLLTEAIHVVAAGTLVRRRAVRLRPTLRLGPMLETARGARLYALSLLLGQVYSRVDVLLLGLLLGTAAAGLFHAAERIVAVTLMVPAFASLALFPAATRAIGERSGAGGALYRQTLGTIALVAVPATAGVWWVAPAAIALLFGDAFQPAVSVLRLLAPVFALVWLAESLGAFLMAADRVAARTRHQGMAVALNLGGNFVLIPLLGIEGAAFATLLSRSVMVALYALELRSVLGAPRFGGRLAIACAGTASFCGVLALLPPQPLFVTVAAGAGVYAAVVLLFPGIRRTELRMLLRSSPLGAARTAPSSEER